MNVSVMLLMKDLAAQSLISFHVISSACISMT